MLRYWVSEPSAISEFTGITILARNPETFLQRHPEFAGRPKISFHQGDILNPSTFPKGREFSHILHGATSSTLGPTLQSLDRYREIVVGTENLLNYAVECGAKRFLLTSSGAVYGSQPEHLTRLPEDYRGAPDVLSTASAYANGKRAAESLCALYAEAHAIEMVIARCFAFVGRDLPMDAHFAIGNFIRDALNAGKILVNGNGSPVRSYLHQDDLARWLTALLKEAPSGAYNVGSDQAISIKDLAFLVRDLLCPEKEVQIASQSTDSKHRNRYVPDIKKIKTTIKQDVQISLEQAIKLTTDAVKAASG